MNLGQLAQYTPLILLSCGALLLLIVVSVILSVMGRFFFGLELLGMISTAIGDASGRPDLVRVGCLVLTVVVLSCCCATAAVGVVGATCFTSRPAALCRLIGR